jgi:hypothetical protein
MSIAECREPERSILFRVFLVTNPNECGLQETHDRRKNLVARELLFLQVMSNAPPDLWQRFTKGGQSIVFGFVAGFSPLWVIAVLFSPSRVASHSLKMAFR